MKRILTLFTPLLTVLILLHACTPEKIGPEGENDIALGGSGTIYGGEHPVFVQWTSPMDTMVIVDSIRDPYNPNFPDPYGMLEIGSTTDSVFLMLTAGRDWFLMELGVWHGTPYTMNGPFTDYTAINFPTFEVFNPIVNRAYYAVDKDSLAHQCNDYLVGGKMARLLGFWGGIDSTTITNFWVVRPLVRRRTPMFRWCHQ